jgi:molybdopterin converting factor small subunit
VARKVAVDVHLPGMLVAVAGRRVLRVRAATLAEAIEALFREVPALRFHLCEDDGAFRHHVLCYLNDTSTREMKELGAELKEGDRVTFVQALSGGSWFVGCGDDSPR